MIYSSGHSPAIVTSADVNKGVPPQLSEPVGLAVFDGSVLSSISIVMFGGHVMTGGVISLTVISCAQVVEFSQASVAVYVRFGVTPLAHVILYVVTLAIWAVPLA